MSVEDFQMSSTDTDSMSSEQEQYQISTPTTFPFMEHNDSGLRSFFINEQIQKLQGSFKKSECIYKSERIIFGKDSKLTKTQSKEYLSRGKVKQVVKRKQGRPSSYSDEQLHRLEAAFRQNPSIFKSDRIILGLELNLSEQQIRRWFSKRKMKQVKQDALICDKTAVTKPSPNSSKMPNKKLMCDKNNASITYVTATDIHNEQNQAIQEKQQEQQQQPNKLSLIVNSYFVRQLDDDYYCGPSPPELVKQVSDVELLHENLPCGEKILEIDQFSRCYSPVP